MAQRFWVFDWFDTLEITTYEDIRRALNNRATCREFIRTAQRALEIEPEPKPKDEIVLYAGRGISLSSRGSCSSPSCVRKQVDDLFRHVWNYFDRIIVDDLTSEIAGDTSEEICKDENAADYVSGWLWALLYLREIGAETLIEFSTGVKYCYECGVAHAAEHGLGELVTDMRGLVSYILQGANLDIEPDPAPDDPERMIVGIQSAALGNAMSWGYRSREWVDSRTREQMLLEEAQRTAHLAFAEISGDFEAANMENAPVGTTSPLNTYLLKRSAPHGDPASAVAFDLQLPVLERLPVKELIAIRMENYELFKNFQVKLRRAIHEATRSVGKSDFEQIKRSVREDYIDIGLAEVRVAMKSGQSVLQRTNRDVVIGLAASTVGAALIATHPVIGGAIMTGSTIATGLAAASKANTRTEHQKVASHDLYFLFKAVRHAEERD